MIKNVSRYLSNLPNDEFVTIVDNLKECCKKVLRKGFNKAAKSLPPMVLNGKRKPFLRGSIERYQAKLKGNKNIDSFSTERNFLIGLIEAACFEWKIALQKNHEFTKREGNGETKFRFQGNYYLYSLVSKENAVNRFPLHIDEHGTARIALGNISTAGSKDIITGEASYDSNAILSLSFERELNNEKYRHSIFSVLGHFPITSLKHAYGVSIRVNQNKRPIARTEVLVCTTDNFDDANTVYEEYFIDSPAFRDEDEKRNGMLNWLTGKYNRLLTAPATPNEPRSTRINEEYVDVHFFAACYLARKGDWENSLMHLYQAYLHGFYNMKLLKEELKKGGCLFELEKKVAVNATPRTNSEYHEKLNCQELIAKIKSRLLI
jgi:hypothetical protein